jgi:hypothetical protein
LAGRIRSAAAQVALALLLAALACGDDKGKASDRGGGLPAARLSAARSATAYTTGMRGMFDLGPALVLLLDPGTLPRARRADRGDPLPDEIVRSLRELDSIQGTCQPRRGDERHAPICDHSTAGYIIRVSEIFQAPGDTVLLYVTAERFRPSGDTTGFQPPLRLEQRYHLTPKGEGWSVARKSRMVR